MAHSPRTTSYALSGLLTWDCLSMYCTPREGESLAVVKSNEDLALYLAFSPNNKAVYCGIKRANRWEVWKEIEYNYAQDSVKIRVFVEINHINVFFDTDRLFSTPNDGSMTDVYELRGDTSSSGISVEIRDGGLEEASKRIVAELADWRESSKPTSIDSNVIFDVGMHDCRDTDFYLKKGFKVVAIEANPTLALYGARLFAQEIDRGALCILNVGLGDCRGKFPFYVNNVVSEWSSFDPSVASRGHPTTKIEIQQYSIKSVFDLYGIPYYLKIDIEDYDKFVIYDLPTVQVVPHYVSVENGSPAIFDALIQAGYARFMFVNQRDVPMARLPQPSHEGITIDYRFVYGSSGPFGRDLGGEWLSVDEMRAFFEDWWRRGPESDSWYDLHARLD